MPRRAVTATCLLAVLAPGAPAAAASGSVGTAEQVAWVRRAAGNFIAAELNGDAAAACAILAAPLRRTEHGRSCAERWSGRLSALRHDRSARAGLRADARAVASARVVVHEYLATIALPAALLGGHSRFAWSENCWMLEH